MMPEVTDIEFSASDLRDLRVARSKLETRDLVAVVADVVGKPTQALLKRLPKRWHAMVDKAPQAALFKGLGFVILTLGNTRPQASRDRLHKMLATTSGLIGGAAGLTSSLIELPVSTCLEVLALSGRGDDDVPGEGYWAVRGVLNRAARNRRPRFNEIDWPRTIRANLKHYQPEYHTSIPETRIGFGHKRSALRDIVLCIDQSGSMALSVVYASIFGAVLASLSAINTRLVVFDTAVVDLSEDLVDPVDVLFGVQLGGGTDIHRALSYCQGLIRQPHDTILILISDLYEGGNHEQMLKRAASLVASGVNMIALLALADEGAPSFDHNTAAAFGAPGIPSFACTPDRFPDLIAAAISRQDVSQWAAQQGVVTAARAQL